jgi:maltooligosyltrehalose trehalohydrolase
MRWGPQLLGDGRTRFALWAPSLELPPMLQVEGSAPMPMARGEAGWCSLEAEAPVGARYRFHLPDGTAVPDPAARAQDGGVHGWSVVTAPDDHTWQAATWRGRPWREVVIWECHAGVLGGFAGVAEQLPQLAELGFTAIELMPVAAFSGTRNWGYDGVLPYAPAEAYGSPAELKALVDRAHGLGLAVYLDVVYNHFGPDGNYLNAYAADFFHPEKHTPWGAAIAFDREPVARYFIDNALMWLTEYRLDGLRFDAVHAIGDNAFLDRMATELRAACPDREIHLMLENEGNDPERLSGPYDAQWNDDFHNAAHVTLTGESAGYYAAFTPEPTRLLARSLAEGFAYQGEEFHPGHPRGARSGHLPSTAFINFLQNHDQVGNRALGERLGVLVTSEQLRAATALQLLTPFIPLIFMGEEVGSHTPFLFFTDFHDQLADAVREGRRKEFAKFPAFADPASRERIPDPNAPATFAASVPQPGPAADAWQAFYRELLAIRAREIVPHLEGCRSLGAEVLGEGAVRARWRLGNAAELVVMANLGRQGIVAELPAGRELLRTGDPASGPATVVTVAEP